MNSTPVICGLDLGSWSFKICAFNGEKFEVLTNEANFRETPSLVGYTPTERLIGQAALIKLKTNFSNTIRAPQRLLGLQRHGHLLQEQLKYEKLVFEAEKDLVFKVQGRQGQMEVLVQEVLISLLGKVKSIIENHQLALAVAYVSVPTYYGQEEREALKRCAELAFDKPVRLVDDWLALAAQYTYNRLKQLKTLEEMKHVVFLDIGYSKVSLSLVQFTRFQGRLLDWQYLPYSGCKNMDQNVCEYYSQLFQQQHKQSILKHPKAFVKLLDAVQRQRTILSANNEYHFNLQYLLNEEDLTYNMKRQELENIIVPVLADIAGAMAAIQSRNCSIPIHAVELMGGASRIPCIQTMAAKIFGMQPSRGMNQSQAITVGSTIIGALERKLLNLQYSYDCISTKQISVRWGKQKRIIFSKRSKANAETFVNIGNQGIINMTIFVELGVIEKQIGHLRFKSPNKITFTLDQNKIIAAKLTHHYFQVYDLHQKSQATWKQILKREEELSQMDMKMGLIYQMKNDYESKFYKSKNKYEELKSFATEQEASEIQKHIKIAEHWIEVQHSQPVVGSEGDFQRYQQKNKEIGILKTACEELQARRRKIQGIRVRYDKLSEQICMALECNITDKQREKIVEVMNWGQEAYQKMENTNWRADDLSEQKLQDASVRVRKAAGL